MAHSAAKASGCVTDVVPWSGARRAPKPRPRAARACCAAADGGSLAGERPRGEGGKKIDGLVDQTRERASKALQSMERAVSENPMLKGDGCVRKRRRSVVGL